MQYAPKTPEDTLDDRFVEACQMLDHIEDMTDILTFAELEVRVKTVDMLQKDGMIDRLEERLKRTVKEVDARDEDGKRLIICLSGLMAQISMRQLFVMNF